MKIICAVLLAVILTFELDAQTNFPLRLTNNQVNLSNNIYIHLDSGKTKNRALEHFPFQFGLDLCLSVGGAENSSPFGGLGYINLNLWDRVILLKLEYGLFLSSGEEPSKFISLSGQFKFADIKNLHKFYAGFGICGMISEHSGVGAYFGNFKYLYATTEHLGITGGFRLFNLGQFNNDFWKGFMFEAGIQIFH